MLELSQTNTAASYYIWYFKLVCASMSCFYVGMHIRANGFRQQVRDLPAQDVSRPPHYIVPMHGLTWCECCAKVHQIEKEGMIYMLHAPCVILCSIIRLVNRGTRFSVLVFARGSIRLRRRINRGTFAAWASFIIFNAALQLRGANSLWELYLFAIL